MAVGIGAAVLAALVLLLYLNSYRNSVQGAATTVNVLVAKSLIPKGTSGLLIGQQELFQVRSIPRDTVKEGALVDPSAIAARTAVADVYPGQQLTAADFTAATTNAIPTRITGAQRGLAVPMEASNGLIGHLQSGDRVDVYVSFNASVDGGASTGARVALLAPDVEVLAAPEEGANVVVLDLEGPQAPKVALAADNGKLWFALRPQSGAKPTPPHVAELRALVLGTKPITAPVVGG